MNALIQALKAAGFSAKLARDGKSIVISRGDEGFFRVTQEDGSVKVENRTNTGRARAFGFIADIKAACAKAIA